MVKISALLFLKSSFFLLKNSNHSFSNLEALPIKGIHVLVSPTSSTQQAIFLRVYRVVQTCSQTQLYKTMLYLRVYRESYFYWRAELKFSSFPSSLQLTDLQTQYRARRVVPDIVKN